MRLSDFKALSFDCYGTLIDWESGMIKALSRLSSRASPELSRNQILEAHARHESEQQAQTPFRLYRDLLAVVYKRLAEQWGISVTTDECVEYGQSVCHWPAFADSAGALKHLKKYFKLIVLSNVDNLLFSSSNELLEIEFDAVYTAEDIGAYKPSDANFNYMKAHFGDLGLTKKDVLHTAESLFHDHVPANRHGLANCWIYRRHNEQGFGATMKPETQPKIDFRFNSMADLVKAHLEEIRHG